MSIPRMQRPVLLLRHLMWPSALLTPFAAVFADDRPATLAAAGGNPLALNAMAFLGWYWKLLLVLVGVAAVLRLFGGRLHARPRPSVGLGEDTYAMAYLAGGPQRVLEASLASLVAQGALRVNAVTRELIAEQIPLEDQPKIERRVRGLLGGSHRIDNAASFRRRMQRELRTSLALMRDRLLGAGLLAIPALQAKAVTPLMFGFLALLGIGTIRMVAGIAADRPVGFLVMSMVATGVLAWWLLRGIGRERITAQGMRLLDECRSSRLGRGGDDKLWMVALLGLAGYGMGPLSDLHHLMRISKGGFLLNMSNRRRGDSSGRGDSFGAGGCAGGGCGGGGCGGGGCGG